MKLVIASDHAGFSLKEEVRAYLAKTGHEVLDLGAFKCEPQDDYPDFAERVGEAIKDGEAPRGILICGSGVGVSIAANKIPGIRAAMCYDEDSARNSREHNGANVLTLGGKKISDGQMREIVRVWLSTDLTEERHRRRIAKIDALLRHELR